MDAGEPFRVGLTGQIGRAEREIERTRYQRYGRQQREGDETSPPRQPSIIGSILRRIGCVRRRQKTARDLHAGRLGLHCADRTERAVAIDFVELVAVYRDVVAGGGGLRLTAKRPHPAKIAAAVINANKIQSVM